MLEIKSRSEWLAQSRGFLTFRYDDTFANAPPDDMFLLPNTAYDTSKGLFELQLSCMWCCEPL